MVIYTTINIDGTDYNDNTTISLNKSVDEYNTTSSFTVRFKNTNGQYNSTFSLNDEVKIYAEKDVTPATSQHFLGIIEDISFEGHSQKEVIVLTGRDYGAILQDIIVSPRIFKNQEAGSIIKSLVIQNANGYGITTNNVASTGVNIDKITFNNVSLFDAIKQLATISGYYFFVDNDKDLNLLLKESVSSGLTVNNTNVTKSNFKTTDNDIFNRVTVYGARQLTGVRETFAPQAGSVYVVDDKPSNVKMTGSAAVNVSIQPGGIEGVADPENESVQFLVDYNGYSVILTSGTTAGDNTGWTGSSVIIDYQRSSPLVSIKQDTVSQTAYGLKDKLIVDRNIKSQDEAVLKATTLLADSKDPKIQGAVSLHGIMDVTPGETVVVDIPFHNISSETFSIINAKYDFNSRNNLSEQVVSLTLNRKIKNVLDIMKEQEIRLRILEGGEVDTSVTNLEIAIGSVSVDSSYDVISRSIGSAFYFHIPGHNQLNSSSALLGDMRAGSTVISG